MASGSLARSAWFSARELAGAHRLTFPLIRLAPSGRAVVDRSSDVCIGGYIRSGNTFAFHAFRLWNPDAHVAHHVHLAEQVARAVRMDVPCAVLVRRPLDAVTSLVIFDDGRLGDATAIRGYTRYHERIAEHRHGFCVLDFAEVLARPESLVERLNERFGTAFSSAPLDEAGKRELLERIERYHRNRARPEGTFSVPSAAKEERKPAIRERLASNPLMAEAEAAYRALMDPAGARVTGAASPRSPA